MGKKNEYCLLLFVQQEHKVQVKISLASSPVGRPLVQPGGDDHGER